MDKSDLNSRFKNWEYQISTYFQSIKLSPAEMWGFLLPAKNWEQKYQCEITASIIPNIGNRAGGFN